MDRAEVFSAPAVSMQQMLLRREERAQEQRAMLEETRCAALVSFTLNIPGTVSPLRCKGPLKREKSSSCSSSRGIS